MAIKGIHHGITHLVITNCSLMEYTFVIAYSHPEYGIGCCSANKVLVSHTLQTRVAVKTSHRWHPHCCKLSKKKKYIQEK